jgi:Domain of unknown function (DUF4796)
LAFEGFLPFFAIYSGQLLIDGSKILLFFSSYLSSDTFFSSDYNNKTDLHIALTTSQGVIVEFDKHGLRRHTTRDGMSLWEQSLVVKTVSEAWYDHWDETLSKVRKNID